MKKLIVVLVLVVSVVGLLRINLPSNEIDVTANQDHTSNIFESAMSGMMFSDTVAK